MPDAARQQSIRALEVNLDRQDRCYQRLLALLQKKRAAIAAADAELMARLCEQEHAILNELRSLEDARLRIVATLCGPGDAQAISTIVADLPEDEGARLTVLAARVRERVAETQRLSGILKTAAETLRNHIGGIMEVVHAAVSNARTYQRHGRLATHAAAATTLDLTS